jgi:hypothetical protein
MPDDSLIVIAGGAINCNFKFDLGKLSATAGCRDARSQAAIQIKLDEIIRVSEAKNFVSCLNI